MLLSLRSAQHCCQQSLPMSSNARSLCGASCPSNIDRIMEPTFFPTPSAFREWLTEHHATERELLVGLFKKGSGEPSITWPESVDEALCFGWIDGIRKRIDDRSYTIRFTPRKPRSIWSKVNISRAQELIEHGRMQPAGLAAFEARRENTSGCLLDIDPEDWGLA